MTRRRPPSIPERRPVFIGCEGESEAAYAGRLQDLLREEGLHVHLVVHNLGRGAGDPFARVRLAVQRLAQLRRTRIAPPERFMLLDGDQAARAPDCAANARRLAAEHDIAIIWQEPCFEAMLLRHLPDRATWRPPNTPEAVRVLEREWPGYRKPMSREHLARRINRDAVRRAARVEPDLLALLQCCGLEE
ncbi:MAG: hypothetical protein U1E20_00240 [Methylocystis sp.]|uniref:RloB domain-containing protein n=1 Tax=Methylocystis sp. TaxID=1911079 RepID=UPI003930B47E